MRRPKELTRNEDLVLQAIFTLNRPSVRPKEILIYLTPWEFTRGMVANALRCLHLKRFAFPRGDGTWGAGSVTRQELFARLEAMDREIDMHYAAIERIERKQLEVRAQMDALP